MLSFRLFQRLCSILLFLICFNPDANSQCTGSVSEADSLELVDFYNDLSGDDWVNNSGWLVDPVSEWVGITLNDQVNENGDCTVGEIFFQAKGLSGVLGDYQFPELHTLSILDEIYISGELPELGGMVSLIEVNLARLQLTGNLSNISPLPNLVKLNLKRNSLSGEIPDFNGMEQLEILDLAVNNFSGTVPDFSGLSNLILLNISSNDLQGEFPDFSSLPELTELRFGSNAFTGNLPYFSGLPKLEIIWAYGCGLGGEFPDLNLPELRGIYFNNNNFSGELPDFSGIPNLRIMTFENNNFSGNLVDFSNLPELNLLILTKNELSGLIPDFNYLPELHELDLKENFFSGEIPDFSNLPELIDLQLGSSQLSGSIPDFSNLGSLEFLEITGSSSDSPAEGDTVSLLIGQIPDFSNLPSLEHLKITATNISGVIPDFSNLPDLLFLQLWSNPLEGNVPDFSNIAKLEAMVLKGNQLTGELPNFSYCPNLESIDLSNNAFTGPVPDFDSVPLLVSVFLSNNLLSGTIPDFSTIPQLDLLFLGDNQLSGAVPDFSNLPILRFLIVCDNPLSGAIPPLGNCPLLIQFADMFDCVSGANVSGQVVHDVNGNCEVDENDPPVPNHLIALNDQGYYAFTNNQGMYEMQVGLGGNELYYIDDSELWFQTCEPVNHAIEVEDLDAVFNELNFLIEPQSLCPLLEVSVGTPLLRRCFDNTYHLQYCNIGTEVAEDAYISVQIDEFLIPGESSHEYSLEGQQMTFQLGDLGVFDCGDITFAVLVSCDAGVGQAHCVEAEIFPNDPCMALPTSAGDKLVGEVECIDGQGVQFTISNEGTDMPGPAIYHVYRNNVIISSGSLVLEAGGEFDFLEPADGATYSLEILIPYQNPLGQLFVHLEGCGSGSGFDTGFINNLPLGDDATSLDIDCLTNIGSFDPNDIQVFPRGLTDANCITSNQSLEYHIRFQNTGTDTAFHITVIDVLPDELDPLSIELLDESHEYNLLISDHNVLNFEFNNILLPDSNVNESGSHGYLRFRIQQKSDNETGTVINNKADIYFDFNEPIETNTVFNTIGPCPEPEGSCADFQVSAVPSCVENSGDFILDFSVSSLFNNQDWTVTNDLTAEEVTASGSSFQLGPFDAGKGYSYTVSPNDSDCSFTVTNSQFECLIGNGIDELIEVILETYPNPAENVLHLQIDSNWEGDSQIEIYDLTGSLLMQTETSFVLHGRESSIDISDLADGMYILKVDIGNTVLSQRFVKE